MIGTKPHIQGYVDQNEYFKLCSKLSYERDRALKANIAESSNMFWVGFVIGLGTMTVLGLTATLLYKIVF
jgi:hypothetical protein